MALATFQVEHLQPCSGFGSCPGCVRLLDDSHTLIQLCGKSDLWDFLRIYLMPRLRLPTWMLTALWDDKRIFVKGQSMRSFLEGAAAGTIKIYKMGSVPDLGDTFQFDMTRLLEVLRETSATVLEKSKSGLVNMTKGTTQDAMIIKVIFRIWEHMHEAALEDIITRAGALFYRRPEFYTKTLMLVLALDAGRDWRAGHEVQLNRPCLEFSGLGAAVWRQHAGRMTPGMAAAACKALYTEQLDCSIDARELCYAVVKLTEACKSTANVERMNAAVDAIRDKLLDVICTAMKEHFNEDDNSECVICLDSRPTVTFLACSHTCICSGCRVKMLVKRHGQMPKRKYDSKVLSCPLCRGEGTTNRAA
jgi:hypothetical protein